MTLRKERPKRMTDYDFIKMQKKLSKYLDEDRFEHTLGVMFTCASLAMVHGYDLKDAQAAGLLHDSAKCIPNKKKLKISRLLHLKKNILFFFMPNLELMSPAQNTESQMKKFFLPSHSIPPVSRR